MRGRLGQGGAGMPWLGLVVTEAVFVHGAFKAVFDRQAITFDGNERLDAAADRVPCCEDGEVIIANIATD